MKRILFLIVLAALAAGCSPESKYLGVWMEPVPGMEGEFQGVKLEKGGAASSVNMQTLVYQNWALHGDSVVLTGQSVGNGQTIDFAENFTLRKEGGEWTLQAQDGSVVYRRNK